MTPGWKSSEFIVCMVVLGGAWWLLSHGDNGGGRALMETCLYAYVGGRSAIKAVVAAKGRGVESA